MAPKIALSRREFVMDAGGLIIGFSLVDSAVFPRVLTAASPETIAAPSPSRLDSWLRIDKEGIVHVFTGKPEIGMGVGTAYAQIVAEELDVPLDHVQLLMGDTASTANQGGVGGSTSIMLGSKPLRNASANARYMLTQMASRRLGVPADQLEVMDGIVYVKGSAKGDASNAEGSLRVQDCRKARTARRSSTENSGPIQIRHRRSRSGNVARTRDPAIGSGRDVCERGRNFRQVDSWVRKNSRKGEFRRCGRGK
jgi:hypothetical protein